jgi:serine protease SohB
MKGQEYIITTFTFNKKNDMAFISEYGLFLLETVTIVAALLIAVAGIIALSSKDKSEQKLSVKKLNKSYQDTKDKLLTEILDKKTLKQHKKAQSKKSKEQKDTKPKLFVLHFNGDIKASHVEGFRKEVTAVLAVADKEKDQVLVTIESPGGMVSNYGLAASQLARIRSHGLHLTCSVDKVAASGGYLMASVANEIIAAPFAIIGSIGVIAQMPNFHRWLKKHDIDFELVTSGEFKRTLTVFGENTDKGREKFQHDLEDIHRQFKEHISDYRKGVNVDSVATGEHWLAKEAYQHKLVDKLLTSDEFILDKIASFDVIELKYKQKPTLVEKLLKPAASLFFRTTTF